MYETICQAEKASGRRCMAGRNNASFMTAAAMGTLGRGLIPNCVRRLACASPKNPLAE